MLCRHAAVTRIDVAGQTILLATRAPGMAAGLDMPQVLEDAQGENYAASSIWGPECALATTGNARFSFTSAEP